MSKTEEEPPSNIDVILAGPTDFGAATARILDELKRHGALAQALLDLAYPTWRSSPLRLLIGFLLTHPAIQHLLRRGP